MEDLWRRFQDALKNYTDATEDRKIAFETLKVKDEKSSKEIEVQMKKIQRLQVSVPAGRRGFHGCVCPSSPYSLGALTVGQDDRLLLVPPLLSPSVSCSSCPSRRPSVP